MDDTSNVKLKPLVQKTSNEIIQSSLANESSTTNNNNNNNRAKALKHLLLLQPPPPPLSSSNTLLTPRKESIKVTLVNENETNTQLLLTSNPIATGKPAMSILDVIAKAKANKAASTSSLGGGGGGNGNGNVSPITVPTSIPTNTTTTPRSPRDFDNPNERLKSKLAKKNWQTVMNVAVVKEMGGGGLSGGGGGDMMNRIDNIYATNAENWTFVSIIITVVTFLSILICFLVYIFFHKFRT
jgi:hypothetical protein